MSANALMVERNNMKTYRAYNIDYDTDNTTISQLPKELFFVIDDDEEECFNPIEDMADLISDKTGYCINGCNYEELV